MTIERAAEIINALDHEFAHHERIDLFAHFVEYFQIKDDLFALDNFCSQCGIALCSAECIEA